MSLTLTVNDEAVEVYLGDIVKDTIETSVGTVPFEWSTGFEIVDVVYAIEQYLAGTPVEVESTGEGWIIDLPSETHPQAEITSIDFEANLINFRWRGSVYGGDCAVEFAFNIDTTPDEVAAAIVGLITG
jgi:hypothetical protein